MTRIASALGRLTPFTGVAPMSAARPASRYALVACFALVVLLVSALTRAALILKALAAGQISVGTLPAIVAMPGEKVHGLFSG